MKSSELIRMLREQGKRIEILEAEVKRLKSVVYPQDQKRQDSRDFDSIRMGYVI